MDNATHLGLDVHKETIAVALLRPGEGDPDERTIANTPQAVRVLIDRCSTRPLVACYEAGPTGYELYRQLASLGVACDVVAPTMIPHRAGARVKTDRIDARNLARLHRAGELTPIRVPTPGEEALRDLVRVREDIKDDRRHDPEQTTWFPRPHFYSPQPEHQILPPRTFWTARASSYSCTSTFQCCPMTQKSWNPSASIES